MGEWYNQYVVRNARATDEPGALKPEFWNGQQQPSAPS